jgi:hypothetical protein
MRLAVPALVERGIAQAEVGGEVDHARRERREPIDRLHRAAVRQAEEQHVAGLELIERDEFQLARGAQVRVSEVDEGACISLARDLRDVDLRVREQQAQQLAPGVAGRAGDGGTDHDFTAAGPVV